ncbi:hypothetical protein Tco_0216326 [Tanacetum coccineum]
MPIRIANNLMDQKLKGYAVKNAKNKRRLECQLHHEGPMNCGDVGSATSVEGKDTLGVIAKDETSKPWKYAGKQVWIGESKMESILVQGGEKANPIHCHQVLTSFIGWIGLANHHAVIVCDEKIVRIPFGDEVLIVQGDRDGKGEKSKLSIISCNYDSEIILERLPNFYGKSDVEGIRE